MEGRTKKYTQLSPERAKVWTEKSPKYHYNQQPHNQNNDKIPVVYYLCRNQQLEHPHFMEVPPSSPDGLYLRDVIERLDVLRGRGMALLYSWSCKRSYKNGFVWHDLCNDDIILPAIGDEYVLKGSELFEESNSGTFSPVETVTLHNQKALPEPPTSSRKHGDSSSSSSLKCPNTKTSNDENGSSSTEYKVYKTDGKNRETCTRGVSTDDNIENSPLSQQVASSPPSSTSSASSSSGKTDTLDSLIRSDAKKLDSFRVLEEEEFSMPRLKASNLIIQLISCGSISVKDHGFELAPNYRPRFSHSKSPGSLMAGKLDCLVDEPRVMDMKLEGKEYFSGSLVETGKVKEGVLSHRRSPSFNADESSDKFDKFDSAGDKATKTKCIPRSIKASLSKQTRCESVSSPLSGMSNGGSKRMGEPLPGRKQCSSVIKIEESLPRELGL